MIFHALVALKPLVSLISRLVACSARIVVDKQTNRQTDKYALTDQVLYPRCACAPRVNDPTGHVVSSFLLPAMKHFVYPEFINGNFSRKNGQIIGASAPWEFNAPPVCLSVCLSIYIYIYIYHTSVFLVPRPPRYAQT